MGWVGRSVPGTIIQYQGQGIFIPRTQIRASTSRVSDHFPKLPTPPPWIVWAGRQGSTWAQSLFALWLVDPYYRICSTRNVPPQRQDWWEQETWSHLASKIGRSDSCGQHKRSHGSWTGRRPNTTGVNELSMRHWATSLGKRKLSVVLYVFWRIEYDVTYLVKQPWALSHISHRMYPRCDPSGYLAVGSRTVKTFQIFSDTRCRILSTTETCTAWEAKFYWYHIGSYSFSAQMYPIFFISKQNYHHIISHSPAIVLLLVYARLDPAPLWSRTIAVR